MKKLIGLFALLAVTNVHAAVFQLKDVKIATMLPSGSLSADLWGSITGFVKFEGPFQEMSCREPCPTSISVTTPKVELDWDIKIKNARGQVVDRFTSENSFGIQQTAANTFHDPKIQTSFEFQTRSHDPNDGRIVQLLFIAPLGSEIEKGTIPLGLFPGVKLMGQYNEPGVWHYTADNVVICCADLTRIHPIVSGHLDVREGGSDRDEVAVAVPEPTTYATLTLGLLLGFMTTRRRSARH